MTTHHGLPSTTSQRTSSTFSEQVALHSTVDNVTDVRRHGVTVAIEGLPHEMHAVRWAADEASRRHVPLTLLHVTPHLRSYSSLFANSTPEDWTDTDANWPDIDTWAAAARLQHPGLPVRTICTTGHVDEDLVQASAQSHLLILGVNRTRGHRPVLGTVADHVAVHAHCPVVLAPVTPVGSALTGTVVVVADHGQPVVHQVFRIAADEAVLHQATLTVVRTDLRQQDHESGAATEGLPRPVWSALDDALASIRRHHHDLDICIVGDIRSPRDVPPADLVVVASHHDDQLWAIDKGSVAMDLIGGARCPILLVPV